MMDESASLTNSGFKKNPIALYLWWALNIGIVIFVFLAFVMSTVTYTHSLGLSSQVNNSFITQQGGLIERQYKVAPNVNIKRGSVVSFCDQGNNLLCEGLGPRWHNEFIAPETWSPAIEGKFAAMTPSASVYVYVSEMDRLSLRATYIDTSASAVPGSKSSATYHLANDIWGVQVHNTSTPNVGVVMYVSNNETYLQTFTTTDTGTVSWTQTPQTLFNIHDPAQNGTAVRTLFVVGDVIFVAHGYEGEGAIFQAFIIDSSQSRLRNIAVVQGNFGITVVDVIASHSLGHNGYFVLANANQIALGSATYNSFTVTLASVGGGEFFVHFNSLQIHGVGTPQATAKGSLLFVGSQFRFVDQPITVSMLVEWQNVAPFITVHQPTNLLANKEHEPKFGEVSVCYQSPSTYEPYGGIFISYIDARSNRAKIIRARPTFTDWNLHLLPSPTLDISATPYGRFRSWLVPTLRCNIATSPGHILIAMQDFLPVFNTFTWHGGYRYAGLAQVDAEAGQTINVVRAGISDGYERLTPGFTYYVWNNGTIAPFTSIFELFSPNGYPYPIGTAVSEGHLHLEPEAFDFN